eukprot:c12035_g1_i1 orf=686-1045(-)
MSNAFNVWNIMRSMVEEIGLTITPLSLSLFISFTFKSYHVDVQSMVNNKICYIFKEASTFEASTKGRSYWNALAINSPAEAILTFIPCYGCSLSYMHVDTTNALTTCVVRQPCKQAGTC